MRIDGRLWIKRDDATFLGRGRVELLEQIKRHGSISKAAKAMSMSYKAAWDTVDSMNNLSPLPLVERSTGGKGGGGSKITQAGDEAIVAFRALERVQERLFDALGDTLSEWDSALEKIGKISIKTSARNQLLGTISAINRGSVNSEVELNIGEVKLHVMITNESLAEMGLETGMEAYALFEASWVMIALGETEGISARNRLKGTVDSITKGAINGEVKLKVGFGSQSKIITASITNEAIDELGLCEGMEASALIKANHILLGI